MDGLMDLRSQVIEYLEHAQRIFERAAIPLGRAERYREIATTIEYERHKVTELELRMAIVAPMKAGKSTIVNAMLGQEILPARESAMTSIPCEIVRENGLAEPVLHVHPDSVARYQQVWRQLHQEIARRTLTSVLQDTSLYVELATYLQQIAAADVPSLETKTVGTDNVRRVLDLLNDLCRLAPAVAEGVSPIPAAGRFEVPRLAVPFRRVNADVLETFGRLVIVDTPGPNEARQHVVLERVVVEQLQSTSLVLVVLDFTQLNTQAAESLADKIQRVTDVVGEENLFVVVNKIDQRENRPASMTSDQVRQFVASHLRLERLEADHVFEVSAKRALLAADFLRELEALGEDDVAKVRELPSAKRMAPLAFGDSNWQEELADAAISKLRQRASKLWSMSNFDAFLRTVIETLMRDAAPRCLSTALKVVRRQLQYLRDDATMRRTAINTGGESLEKEISLLNEEIEGLAKGRRSLEARLENLQKSLKEQIDSAARSLQSGAEVNIEDLFLEETLDKSGFWRRALNMGLQWFGWERGTAPPRQIHFGTQAEATWFANYVLDHAIAQIRPKVDEILIRVKRRIDGARKVVEQWIINETRPILLSAAKRLQKAFGVSLEVPVPQLGDPLDAIPDAARMSTRIEGRVRTEWRWEKIFWFIHLPWPRKVKDQDRFSVSIDEIARQVNKAIHERLDQLLLRLNDFDGDFRDSINDYFRGLQEYLAFYRESLEKALETQKSSLVERERATQELDDIAINAHTLFERIEALHFTLGRWSQKDDSIRAPSLLDAPIELFVLNDAEDDRFRDALEKHLFSIEEAGIVRVWHYGRIGAGEDRQAKVNEQFSRTQIFILLVSADLLSCPESTVLMERAFEREAAGKARVVPVLVRACDLSPTRLAHKAILPRDRRPISGRSNLDMALSEVAGQIREEAQRMQVEVGTKGFKDA